MGTVETMSDFILAGFKITADSDCSHEIKRRLLLRRKVMTNLDSILKSRDNPLPSKNCLGKAMVFPVVMYGCASWTIKKVEHWRIDAFELWCWINSWEFLGLQGDQTSLSKGNQSWIFFGRTDAEAETPILWPPAVKNWLIGKDPDAGKDWRQEKKGMTEDEMVGWHHWLDRHEFEQAPGVGDGQGSLAWCSSWGHKDQTRLSDWTDWTDNGKEHEKYLSLNHFVIHLKLIQYCKSTILQ